MAQEQQDQVHAPDEAPAEADNLTASTGATAAEPTADATQTSPAKADGVVLMRRVKKKGKLVNVEEVMPRPSFWPLVLAFAMALLFLGFIATNWYIMGAAGIILLASFFGLVLERR